jgi:probable phosphoglycerate mutase
MILSSRTRAIRANRSAAHPAVTASVRLRHASDAVYAASMPAPKPTPPTLVLLVRHGVTPTTGKVLPGRAAGLHLADDGRRQAEALAQRIARLERVAAVYTSPLERARETAAPIARARGLALLVERGLHEVDIGEWTGLSLRRALKRPEWRLVHRYPSGFRFAGGESFAEMQTRMTTTLARLVERHRGETIVAVSHADPIKAAVAYALGTHLDLFQRIAIAPGSITAIAYAPAGPRVLTLNSVDGDLGTLGG